MIINTTNFQRAHEFIDDLIAKKGIGAILGEKGAGKTFIKHQVIGAYEEKKGQYTVVDVTPMTEGARNITSIMSELIRELSGEKPRNDIEARRRQLRRVIGEAEMAGRVIILAIDEAQDLHKSTIRGLKKLHELGYGRRNRLFTTVLFGQPSLLPKISDNELGPRVKRVQLAGLSVVEKKRFVENPDVFTEKALKIFLSSVYSTPLMVLSTFEELDAMRDRLEQPTIDERLINNYLLEDLNKKIFGLGKSMRELSRDIEDVTGEKMSPATLSQVKNGKYDGNLANTKSIFDSYLGNKGLSRSAAAL